MKETVSRASVVDMAYEIIAMDREINQLRHANKHLTALVHMNNDSTNNSIQAGRQLMSDVLLAVMDRDSAISMGLEAKRAAGVQQ